MGNQGPASINLLCCLFLLDLAGNILLEIWVYLSRILQSEPGYSSPTITIDNAIVPRDVKSIDLHHAYIAEHVLALVCRWQPLADWFIAFGSVQ